jgi:hypothetical protein
MVGVGKRNNKETTKEDTESTEIGEQGSEVEIVQL